jgi:chemotaxis regulatin CheY-phosphate phosphatase CheZ
MEPQVTEFSDTSDASDDVKTEEVVYLPEEAARKTVDSLVEAARPLIEQLEKRSMLGHGWKMSDGQVAGMWNFILRTADVTQFLQQRIVVLQEQLEEYRKPKNKLWRAGGKK